MCTIIMINNNNNQSTGEDFVIQLDTSTPDRRTDGQTDMPIMTKFTYLLTSVPLIRSRPWRYINLFTCLFTYLLSQRLV